MTEQTLLAFSVTPYGVVSIQQPGATRAERDLPDLRMPATLSRRQVVAAQWPRNDDGHLEMRWLPTIKATARRS